MTQVYQIDPLQDPRWEQLVLAHPHASVFHTPDWLNVLRRTYGYRPIVFTTSPPTGKLRDGIVFCRVRSWLTGRRMVSLPFSDHCEPLLESAEQFDFLTGYLQTCLDVQDCKYLEVRPINVHFGSKGEDASFRPHQQFCLHRIDLSPSIDKLFQSFDKDSVQRRIRRAERAGLVEQCGRSPQLLRQFYRLMVLTRMRHHLPPQPYTWFRNLVERMGDAIEIRVAYKDGTPIASILTLRFRDVAYYKYGCSDVSRNNLGATPMLFWRAISDAKAAGAREFDLGRTELENQGLITFKNHWAASPESLVYWRYPAIGAPAVENGWKMRTVKGICSCLPPGLLTASGRLLYRHIG